MGLSEIKLQFMYVSIHVNFYNCVFVKSLCKREGVVSVTVTVVPVPARERAERV